MIRAETHQAAFEKLAESYCEWAQGADLTPLNPQRPQKRCGRSARRLLTVVQMSCAMI
jgi:hypothetical protein